jgi:hypothetical protein
MRLLARVTLGMLVLVLCGCGPMERISEGAFRNATATGAGMELERLGYHVHGRLVCVLPRGNTLAVVRVTCAGRTVTGQQVAVDGIAHGADTRTPAERYVITVGGREVLRKPCLGLGCGKIAPH